MLAPKTEIRWLRAAIRQLLTVQDLSPAAPRRIQAVQIAQLLIGRRPRCRVCGCTEGRACAGGCSWVEADLCSGCA